MNTIPSDGDKGDSATPKKRATERGCARRTGRGNVASQGCSNLAAADASHTAALPQNAAAPETPKPSGRALAEAVLKRSRSDAAWNRLTTEQQDQLEDWLFEEHLSYADACERAKRELGFTGSESSIRRFRHHVAQQRTLAELADAQAQVAAIQGAPVDVPALCEAGMKVVAQLFLRQVATEPADAKQWGFLAKLVLRHQAASSRESTQREENRIREGQLMLAREKWQDELRQRALAEADAKKVLEAEAVEKESKKREAQNSARGHYAYNRRANRIRYSMFGENLARYDMLPESAEEEEAMNAVKALPPETSQKERQSVAREAFKRMRKRIADEERELVEKGERQRAEILRRIRELEAKAAAGRKEEARQIVAADEQAIKEAVTKAYPPPLPTQYPRPEQSRFLVPLWRPEF